MNQPKQFTDKELLDLHECLKQSQVPNKMPHSELTDKCINIMKELLNVLPTEDQKLAVYLYMSYDTLLNIISERSNIITEIIKE